VQRCPDVDTFRRHPIGRFVGGPGWLHFCAHAGLWGVILHARPDGDAAEQMTRAFAVQTAPTRARHASYVDARYLDGIDPSAFAILERYARRTLVATLDKVHCLALVPPAGMQGAVVAGFYRLLAAPLPIQLFETPADALAWIGETDAAGLAARLDEILVESRGVPSLVAALGACLRAQLPSPDLEAICRTLGISRRSLQRRLRDAGTSLSRELLAVRLAEAEQRLRDSDAPITTIALELGFSSSQIFSRQFKRATGQTPAAWAKANRGGRI
jgi:AraC-like DNA-binding protein